MELDLTWSRYCITSEVPKTFGEIDLNAFGIVYEVAIATTGATYLINVKFYVPVVTFSVNDNIGFLRNMKQEFKRTIYWNKCRFEIKIQTKNNNLDYPIDSTCRNINFKNGDVDQTRNSFNDYYMPLVEMKDFNVLIYNKPFFDQPVKK